MRQPGKCLKCYQSLGGDPGPLHEKCSKAFFGDAAPPVIPYSLDELSGLAREVVRERTAIPGVQAKISLHLERSGKKSGKLTIVGLWGYFILKPPVERYPEMPETEDLTMRLAELFGIRTVEHCLLPLKSGELAYITKRIDRDPKTGSKIHMEDMCQVTERLTEDKYKGSMEQIGRAILRYSSNPLFDAISFFEAALFCFLTGNADMHLKNFSLVYKDPSFIGLSPAYDLLATRLLIPESADPEESALTINGKKSRLGPGDFEALARNLGMDMVQIGNVYKKFERAVPNCIEFVERGFIGPEKKSEFKSLIRSRAERLTLI
jgi:serine/threonine-protein kinase HipA